MRKSGVDFGLQVELFVDKSDVNFGVDRNNGKNLKACILKASLKKSAQPELSLFGLC